MTGSLGDRLKSLRRNFDPSISDCYLEIHHIEPHYRGGNGEITNMYPLTRPEHALAHYLEAKLADNREDRNANNWAVRKIVKRMEKEELKEFNHMLERRRI
jgi:hypothetical protein